MLNESMTALAEQRFVALTTFKRNGEGVSTPMWIGRDGADLFVWTPADTWKVKRLGNDPRVLLAPSNRFGKVRDGVVPAAGTAEVITDAASVERLQGVIRAKYGLEHQIMTAVEATLDMIGVRRRKPHVIVRIALSD